MSRPTYARAVTTRNRPQSPAPRSKGRSGPAVARVAFVALAMILAVACGSDPKAPTITAPDGFMVASSDKEGFAFAVPAEWTPIPLDLNPANFDRTANSLRLENPKLASILNQARVLGQSGGLYMAVARDGVANVNLTSDTPEEKTLAAVVAASKAGLADFGATNIGEEPATLSGQPATRLRFRIPVETDGGTVETDAIQYYMLKSKKAYILTVAAAPAQVVSTIASTFTLR